MKKISINKHTAVAACILCAIFVLDVTFPPGIAIGVMYLFCFLSIARQSKTTIIVFAICIAMASLIKFIFFFPPSATNILVINRCITITAISIFTFISFRRRTQFEKFYQERVEYEKQLEEMVFMISHEVRKPIANCIGLMHHLESDTVYTQDELKEMVKYLKTSIYELEGFTHKLTVFADEIKQKEKIDIE